MSRDPLEDQLVTKYQELQIALQEANERLKDAQEIIRELTPKLKSLEATIIRFGWYDRIGDNTSEEIEGMAELIFGDEGKGSRIAKAAKQYLRNHGNEWTRLSVLYSEISGYGIKIGGKNPSSTLSAHLSNSGWFESDRTKGWRILPNVLAADLKALAKKFPNRILTSREKK